jgi:hypothetical protein
MDDQKKPDEERIIQDEATYFTNRNFDFSTDSRAIDRFRLLKERLKDFYSPEYKAIFLDQVERLVTESFTDHKNKKHGGRFDSGDLQSNYYEKLLFYIHQELNTLPALARQKHASHSDRVRDQVFVSFSPSDQPFLEEIKKHFKPFEEQIKFWDNSDILPGQNWKEEIRSAIDKTKVVILLLSADFLASDFIISNELTPLLRAAENDGAVILSVILRPCLYDVVDELGEYQTMNPGNVPLLKMDDMQREELYVNLVRQTQRILKEQ